MGQIGRDYLNDSVTLPGYIPAELWWGLPSDCLTVPATDASQIQVLYQPAGQSLSYDQASAHIVLINGFALGDTALHVRHKPAGQIDYAERHYVVRIVATATEIAHPASPSGSSGSPTPTGFSLRHQFSAGGSSATITLTIGSDGAVSKAFIEPLSGAGALGACKAVQSGPMMSATPPFPLSGLVGLTSAGDIQTFISGTLTPQWLAAIAQSQGAGGGAGLVVGLEQAGWK